MRLFPIQSLKKKHLVELELTQLNSFKVVLMEIPRSMKSVSKIGLHFGVCVIATEGNYFEGDKRNLDKQINRQSPYFLKRVLNAGWRNFKMNSKRNKKEKNHYIC